MKTICCSVVIFTSLWFASKSSTAQCDASLFREIQSQKDEVFGFLKNYDIKISNLNDVPLNKEFSYVFSKGAQYQFKLYQSEKNTQKVKLKVLNSRDEEISLNTIHSEPNEDFFHIYCNQTGIYRFVFYTDNPTDACAVMQLNYLKHPNEVGKETRTKKFDEKSVGTLLEELTPKGELLKEFQFIFTKTGLDITRRGIDPLNYTYVFSKGTSYQLAFSSEEKNAGNFIFKLKDHKGNPHPLKTTKKDDGIYVFDFDITQTGVYQLEFAQKKETEDKIVVVLLKRM